MSDFDITTLHNKSSFLASMRKRRALGLLDSDSEDETSSKPTTKKVVVDDTDSRRFNSLSDTTNNNVKDTADKRSDLKLSTKPDSTSGAVGAENVSVKPKNPYIKDSIDLDFIKSLSAAPKETKKPPPFLREQSSVIELMDDEYKVNPIDANIEGLDPELVALLDKTTPSTIGPQKITVKLQYIQKLENLSGRSKPIIERLMKPIKLIIMDNTQFQKILDVYCSHKKLKKTEMVLVFNNDRLFLNGTPAGVGMCSTTVNLIEVYTERSYSIFLKEREDKKQERLRKWAQAQKEEENILDSAQFEIKAANKPATATDEDNEKMFIKLRGSDNKIVTLRVKKTSTIESIITKYKEITGINSNIRLQFEGENLDTNLTIQDTELEDEDLVEVNTVP